jgi:hypothetical protein
MPYNSTPLTCGAVVHRIQMVTAYYLKNEHRSWSSERQPRRKCNVYTLRSHRRTQIQTPGGFKRGNIFGKQSRTVTGPGYLPVLLSSPAGRQKGSFPRKNPISHRQMSHISQARWTAPTLSHDNILSASGFKFNSATSGTNISRTHCFELRNLLQNLLCTHTIINFNINELNFSFSKRWGKYNKTRRLTVKLKKVYNS